MTTNITLPSAVVEQALDALEAVCGGRCNAEYNPCWQREVAETLRSALAQQAEPVQEPVAWMDPASGDVISDARHEAWERDFGLAGKGKAALFTVPLYTAPPQQAEPESCTWQQDGDSDSGLYGTSCGRYFNLDDGTPEDNKMHWCCYCGKRLVQLLTEEDNDE